jgi:hypothetical protein
MFTQQHPKHEDGMFFLKIPLEESTPTLDLACFGMIWHDLALLGSVQSIISHLVLPATQEE